MKILCCGIFPALQRTLELKTLKTGAVNRVRSVTQSVGGKATNAARVLKTLGADPLLFGFTGGDTGSTIKKLLDNEGIGHVFVETSVPTRTAQTLLTDDAPDFTELVEDCEPLVSKNWNRQCRSSDKFSNPWKILLQNFQTLEKSIVILSGTLPAHAPQEIYAELIHAASVPVLLDTSGAPLLAALEARPALVKINASELLLTTKQNTIEEAARELIAQGAGAVGITDGSSPARLFTPEGTHSFSIPDVAVKSTLGCGDAVNAGIAFALQKGSALPEAFIFGLACGAANAQTALPGVIDPEQIATLVPQIKVS